MIMNWEVLFCIALMSLCFIEGGSAQPTTANVTEMAATEEITAVSESTQTEETFTTDEVSTEETTEAATFGYEKWQYPSPCYIEKSKAAELITRMNQTVQLLIRKDEYLECYGYDAFEVVKVEGGDVEMCSDERIRGIQKDIIEVAGGLIELAIRTSDVSPQEVERLDIKKFQLVYSLNALRVFYGPSPCDGSTIVLFPLRPLIEYLEYNLEQKIALFYTLRTKRPLPATTSAVSRPTFDAMLNPDKSLAELTEMAVLNPPAMSKAIPQIVSERYNGRMSKFGALLTFIQGLPTADNKIVGLSAVYDEMYRYQKPEIMKMAVLATHVQRVQDSVSNISTPVALDAAASLKLADLVHDIEPSLSTLISVLNPGGSFTKDLLHVGLLKYIAILEAISRLNLDSPSSFNNLVAFIEGLSAPEHRMIGYAALREDFKQRNSLPAVPQLVRLAGNVMRLNQSTTPSPSLIGPAAWSKFVELARELSPLILTSEKALCQVTNVAYQRQLHVYDPKGWPESAYVYQNSSYTKQFRIFPRINSNQLVFYIEEDYPLYASDTNPNTNNTIYQAKPSERFVLEDNKNLATTKPLKREIDWKIVPAEHRQDQFRILSAKAEDFMFVHKSAIGNNDYRRVLLGRKNHSNHDLIPDADLWTLKCQPGTYDLPSD